MYRSCTATRKTSKTLRSSANPSKKRAKTHKDVVYEVHTGGSAYSKAYEKFDDAAVNALGLAIHTGGSAIIDVIVHSVSGARWFGGDDAVERYKSDPEASVFERIKVIADSMGMIA